MIKSNFSSYVATCQEEDDIKTQDLIKSFILLCHAEFENYFESICKRIIANSKATYDKNNILLPSLLSLSLMSVRNFDKKDRNYPTTKSRLDKLYSNYIATIQNNNGIKEENLSNLLPMIGIDMSTIDATFLAQLTAFGRKRGQVAHSVSNSVLSFKNECRDIDYIISELKELDEVFENIK